MRDDVADLPPGSLVLVGCSGGPDSLALAAATAHTVRRGEVRAGAVVVDHALQQSSAAVADTAARQCRDLGLDPVDVVVVAVSPAGDGLEAAARRARHAAFEAAAQRLGAARVLLGHTRDDQAEQVLLGLARGSGARSLSGMPARRGRISRPFLAIGRSETTAACAAQGLIPWRDPHNDDVSFRRVRARRAVADLERDLGPGVTEALARTARLLRRDADLLDELADRARDALGPGPWQVGCLEAVPEPVRARVWRRLALESGSPAGALTAAHVEALDRLLLRWHGQGPVDLPGRVRVHRVGHEVAVLARPAPR